MEGKTKIITATGLGIALFVVLTLCLQVPIFQNYYLCLGYIVMAVYLYSLGVSSGVIVGVFGTIIYCLIIGGLNGLPGWATGNIAIALILGLIFRVTRKVGNNILWFAINTMAILIGTALGILVIKSGVEFFLYAQPFWFRVTNNVFAFIADCFVLIVALPLCKRVDGLIKKYY